MACCLNLKCSKESGNTCSKDQDSSQDIIWFCSNTKALVGLPTTLSIPNAWPIPLQREY